MRRLPNTIAPLKNTWKSFFVQVKSIRNLFNELLLYIICNICVLQKEFDPHKINKDRGRTYIKKAMHFLLFYLIIIL